MFELLFDHDFVLISDDERYTVTAIVTINDVAPGISTRTLAEWGCLMALLGVKRHELHRLPRVVVREAIANAVAHRSYDPVATAEPVRIEPRPDRVVVR